MMDPKEKRARLEGQAKDLLQSPVWVWLKEHLEREMATLISMAADPRLSTENRALLCGRLGLVSEILTKPEAILRVAEATKRAPLVMPD